MKSNFVFEHLVPPLLTRSNKVKRLKTVKYHHRLSDWLIIGLASNENNYLFLTSTVPAKIMKALVQELCQGDFLDGMFVTPAGGGRKKNSKEEERNNNDSSHFLLVPGVVFIIISLVLFAKISSVPPLSHHSYLPTHKLELTGFSAVIFTLVRFLFLQCIKLRNKWKQMLELFWREIFTPKKTNNSHLVPSKFSSR